MYEEGNQIITGDSATQGIRGDNATLNNYSKDNSLNIKDNQINDNNIGNNNGNVNVGNGEENFGIILGIGTYIISANNVAIRERPNKDSKKIGEKNIGEIFEVLKICPSEDGVTKIWAKIYNENNEGYICIVTEGNYQFAFKFHSGVHNLWKQ